MPTPVSSDIEAMLREFLEDQAIARAQGATPENLAHALKDIATRQVTHEGQDEVRHKEVMDRMTSFDKRLVSTEVDVVSAQQSIIDHGNRLVSVEKDAEFLEKNVDRIEQSGAHDVPEILRAAKDLKSMSPRRSDPPKSGLAKALANETARSIGKVLVLLLIALGGWIAHHITLQWTSEPSSASHSSH